MSPYQSPLYPLGSEEYWLEYWKNVFSHDVLGYSDLLLNLTRGQNNWWKYQSAPWVATVINFELKSKYYWKEEFAKIIKNNVKYFPLKLYYLKHVFIADEYCRYCGESSRDWYCSDCLADRCQGCGEIGCGSYMCRPCRRNSQY